MFERATSLIGGHGVALGDIGQQGRRLVGLREALTIVRRRRRLVGLCVAAFTLPALIYIALATRIYSSTTTLLVEPRRQSIVDRDLPAPQFGTDAAVIESQVQIIRSPPIARRVAAKLDLVSDPEFGLGRKGRLAGVRQFLGGIVGSVLGADAVPAALADTTKAEQALTAEQKVALVASRLEQRVTVGRVGPTHVISVTFSAETPENASRIANAFAEAYLTDAYENRYDATRRAAVWLEDRLEQLRMKTIESEQAVEEYRSKNNLILAGGRLVAEQQVTEINNQLVAARARVAETKARLDTIQGILSSGSDPGALNEALTNESINRLKIQYSDISRRIADLQSRYGERHPAVRNAQAELADTQALIQNELRRVAQSLRNEYDVAVAREQSAARNLSGVETRAATDNSAQVRLRELERDANSDRTLYQTFLSRFKETSVQEGLPAAEARVLAPAERTTSPSEPRSVLILALALVFGSFAGLGAAFVAEFADESMGTRDDVEGGLNLPLIARIPLVRDIDRDVSHLAIDQPLSTFAEAIRNLRIALSLGGDSPARVVAVASALPGEGKTTTAVNLAQYAAASGLRTIILDADLRNPSLTRTVAPDVRLGLGHVLLQDVAAADVTIVDPRTGLAIIPHVADPRILDTAGLLSSRRMASLVAELRQAFDLIILDVSPLLPVIDARLLFEHVDKMILIVEWKKTPRPMVQEALRHVRPWHGKIVGVALNKVDGRRSHLHHDYASEAYGRKYPHYYGHTV